mmetsp:Transcript_118532/g.221460  ORF Transcript_118532/g.221460 Transcript_118532/m.221460 type:complete len:334 (-) Transcript_118532:7-1008(-)
MQSNPLGRPAAGANSEALHEDGAERLSGPAGPSAPRASWDSVILDMHNNGHFILELWCFREVYRMPNESNGEVDMSGRPRMSERWMDELRVTLTGTYTTKEAPALQLHGFDRKELNRDFVEDIGRCVDGVPTWWSDDGLYFLYFAQDYKHWKANALRIAGGDGLKAISLGSKKAGCGYAHSGPAEQSAEGNALRLRDGWFEAVHDEWEPLEPDLSLSNAFQFEFHATAVEVEDKTVRGKDISSERLHAGPLAFRGWRHTAGANRGELRLMLPRVPKSASGSDVALVEDSVVTADAPPAAVQTGEEGGYRGDPDVIIVRPPPGKKTSTDARAKL